MIDKAIAARDLSLLRSAAAGGACQAARMVEYIAWRAEIGGATVWPVAAPDGPHRVLPDGVMDLMWHRGRLVVAGANTHAMTPGDRSGGETRGGLRFAPGWAYTLLGSRPMN